VINSIWYTKKLPLYLYPLVPITWLFRVLIYYRKWLYNHHLLGFKTQYFPVPIVIVGNVTVGGTGKTPLIIHLYHLLRSHGYTPGIISRGYTLKTKSKNLEWVLPTSLPTEVGDEPVLLAQRLGCPIVVSANRPAAVQALLDSRQEGKQINIILSDDGLQHYALGRDLEIVVLDGQRQFGNGYCLPLGPLREPITRLALVDLIIANGMPFEDNQYDMNLVPENFDTEQYLQNLKGRTVHAVAGIGNPERFFKSLRAYDIQIIPHIFADHYDFKAEDIQFNDDFPVIMTEKDAVKCQRFMTDKHWVLRVKALVNPLFDARFMVLMKEKGESHG
jgi:tetraacyldisaccharide 4'-kinase